MYTTNMHLRKEHLALYRSPFAADHMKIMTTISHLYTSVTGTSKHN